MNYFLSFFCKRFYKGESLGFLPNTLYRGPYMAALKRRFGWARVSVARPTCASCALREEEILWLMNHGKFETDLSWSREEGLTH